MDDDNPVILRADRQCLANFVVSLLKQPRRIEDNFINNRFFIDLDWIINLINICDQRLSQNPHSLVSFQCLIDFSDGHRDGLCDLASLRSYYSSRPCITTGFDLSFSYLVDFPNTPEPEKQDIRVSVRSSFENPRLGGRGESSIYVGIFFSNLTWGEDVSRHLAAQVQTVLTGKRLSAFAGFVQKHDKVISFIFAAIYFVLFTSFVLPRFSSSIDIVAMQRLIDDKSDSLHSISEKIISLIRSEISRENSRPFTFLPIFIIPGMITVFIPDLTLKFSEYMSKSFVILNDHTKHCFQRHAHRRTRMKWILIGAAITVPLGVLAATLKSLFS